ncbi:sialate O-acetylesterase, partial [Zobellia nedashkovskayae]
EEEIQKNEAEKDIDEDIEDDVISEQVPTNEEPSEEITPETEEFGYDIILIAGQSNTHGGTGYNSTLDASEDRINQFGRNNGNDYKIVDAVEPLDHHTRSTGKIGFGLTFAKLYKNQLLNSNREILIIPCGKNSTGFKDGDWNKGDLLYNDMIERVTHVLQKYPSSSLKVILWHQGENDVYNKNFANTLDQFISDVRTDLKQISTPFILGGMVPFWVNTKPERITHQQLLADTVNRVNIVGFANPSYPSTIVKQGDDEVDYIHYDAAGQRELGRRYFNEYLKLK